MPPRVSVVVPNYNHSRFLAQRLDTIVGQTLSDFELFVLDDASTDSSLETIARYRSDARIQVIENRVNSGCPFKQWNRGVGMARGEFVWIAESDDYADPRLLERLVGCLEQYPNAGLAYCQSWVVDEQGQAQHLALRQEEGVDWTADFVLHGADACSHLLLHQNVIPSASGVVFRRSLYDGIGGAPEHMRLCGDWLTWSRILFQADLAYVAEPLNFHREHSATVRKTTNLPQYAAEAWEVSSAILSRFVPPTDDRLRLARRHANEWASVVVQEEKRLFDAALANFRRLKELDSQFPRYAGLELLHYLLSAAKRRFRDRA